MGKKISQISSQESTSISDGDLFEGEEAGGTSFFTAFSVIKSTLKTYFDTLYLASIGSLTAKTTLTGADQFGIADSEASDASKKITWTNVLSELQSDLAASTTASGVVELAIASEVNTGTDATRAVTPDALAGSNLGIRYIVFTIANSSTTPTTGDGKAHFVVPAGLNGMNVVSAIAVVTTVSSSGTPTFALRRERSGSAVDVFSTNVTIDANEKTSSTAATAVVINASNDDLATADILYADLDTVGTGAMGHQIVIGVQLP